MIDEKSVELKRERAQILSYEAIQQLMLQNVGKTAQKTFTQYTKENIIMYLQSPLANIDNIREVSRFLTRYSMIYKKLIAYYATTPLYYYHVDPIFDLNKGLDFAKVSKNYYTTLQRLQQINMSREMSNIVATALRDGAYYGFIHDSEGKDGFWIQGLDPKYCKIAGKTSEGKWVFRFNAAYFDNGNNKEFVTESDMSKNSDGGVLWDDVFVQGYADYQANKSDKTKQWFVIPPEKSICLIAGNEDEFDMPLPFFVPLFIQLLDLLDLESLFTQKSALENYMLLVSKIPTIQGSEDVDDFAVSIPLVQSIQEMIDAALPDLIGSVYTPLDVTPITFNKSNTTDSNDMLSQSIANLYNNAGASQLVVSGGASTNSVGLKHTLQNDTANTFTWVERLETELNAYIKYNITDTVIFEFHRITWYNEDEYVGKLKDAATLGDSVLPYFSAIHGNDYKTLCSIQFENALGIKDMLRPLSTSFTESADSDSKGGADKKNEDDLSPEGIATRDGDKNGTENV